MDTVLRDLRFAVRGLRRTPGFTVAAVLALALGIGATTAIFSVVHAVLLRSLGWGQESRLISVRSHYLGHGIAGLPLSVPEYQDLLEAPFLEQAGVEFSGTAALQGERAERVKVAWATASFFETLGVQPALGRSLTRAEDLAGNDNAALLTWPAWQKRYAADPAALGKSVTLDGHAYTLVGVLPEGFHYEGAPEFYLAFGLTPEQLQTQRVSHFADGVARLKPGVTVAQAQRSLAELSERLRPLHPESYSAAGRWTFGAEPLRDRFVGASRRPLLLLLGAVFFVLLIACGNVANLLLARSTARERELAVRAALGAARSRIVRQLLTEALLLSALGAGLGLLLAGWGLDVLIAAAPEAVRTLADVRLERAVLLFAAAVSVGTTLVFGLLPALRASSPDLASALKDGGRGTATHSAGRLRGALVVAQVALSLLLLAGAGLMLRSFESLLRVSPGFDAQGAFAASVSVAGPAYDNVPAAQIRYVAEALRRVSALPGVESAAAISQLPLEGKQARSYEIEDYVPAPGEPKPASAFRAVTPGLPATLRIPVVAGRDFGAADDEKGALVVMVNQAWIRRYFPGREVLGRRIKLSILGKAIGGFRTIVGVLGDVREDGLDQPAPPILYLPHAQLPDSQMAVVVRGNAAGVREALSDIDASQPVDRVAPLDEVLASALSSRKFPLQMLGAFAALALLLSALGIYGVTSYAVAQRTREIGVRMAIGAQASDVLRMVLRDALRLVGLGLVLGLAGALAGAQLIGSLLYGVGPRDPVTYLGISALLGGVAVLASLVPALRAARVPPMSALRD